MSAGVDVAVVGAGPAGLGAAAAAAAAGLRVAVFDEYPVAGGRLLGQLYRDGAVWHVGRESAARLVDEARRTGAVELCLSTSVYAMEPVEGGWRLYVAGRTPIDAAAVVVATGATEVPLPLPGWTLPGVLGVGAAQVLTNVWGVRPGDRGIVVGLSPLGFAIAQELDWAGVRLASIVPAIGGAGRGHLPALPDQWNALFGQRGAAPAWTRPGAALLSRPGIRRVVMPRLPQGGLPVFGTRLRLNVAAEAIDGDESVTGVRLRRVDGDGRPFGRPWHEAADFVLLAGGLRPIPDLFRAVGVRTETVAALGGEVPVVGPDGETALPGLFAAGNALGVEGSRVAEAQGRRAGLGAAALLGRRVPERETADARAAVEIARRAAPFAFQAGVGSGHEAVAALWAQKEARTGHAV